MKIRITLDVPEMARVYLCRLNPDAPATRKHAMTRAALLKHLREYVDGLSECYRTAHDAPLTAQEMKDASDAVKWLRSSGKTDGQIRSWLLMQRARYHFTEHLPQ